MELQIGNFDVKKALEKFAIGIAVALVALATKDSITILNWLPEGLKTATVVGAIFEIFDYIVNVIKNKLDE